MALAPFHNVLFPEDISYGSSGGPGFNTTVIELASGAEQRNVNWSQARAAYDASHGIKTREQMEDLLDFFYARRGRAYGFRFKDWMDYELSRQVVGIVPSGGFIDDEEAIQIYKRYEGSTDYYFDRPLTKLVPDTLQMWVNNSPIDDPENHIDVNTGLITGGNFTSGTLIEVSCEFHVPVRFDIDEMKVTHDDWETMSWPSIPLVELKANSLLTPVD